MFLELLYSLSCLNQVPSLLKLYNSDNDFKYKNLILFLFCTQTLIATISDSYSLIYTNYLSKMLKKLDTLHIICISTPLLFYSIRINNLNCEIEYFIYSLSTL